MSTPRLLVALDLDAYADAIVDAAADLALRLGAQMTLLHVIPVGISVDPDVLRNPSAHPTAAHRRDELEAEHTPALQRLGARAASEDVVPSLRIAHGAPADAIVQVARDLDATLILLGTHGRSGLARVALGSVAEAVIRHADVPVVVVPTHGAPATGPVVHREIPLGA